MGIAAGKDIRSRWLLPLLLAALSVCGAWLAPEWGETDFLLYGAAYLAIGYASALFTAMVRRCGEKRSSEDDPV